MKRNLFLLGLAVAAMTSCTNDEVLEQAQPVQKAIGFEGFVNKTSRAVDDITAPANNGGLTNFYVWGYYETDADTPVRDYVFENVAVTKGTDGWGYTGGDQYWSKATYYFAAYANQNNSERLNNVSFGLDSPTLKITNHTISYNTSAVPTTSDAKDLVARINKENGSETREAAVDFTFTHLLSKIQLNIIHQNDQNLSIDITDVVISNVKSKGTFAYTYETDWSPSHTNWTTSEVVNNFKPVKAQTLTTKEQKVSSQIFYVLPQELDGIEISFTAYYYQEGNPTPVVTQPLTLSLNTDKRGNEYAAWEPNIYYIYNIGLPSSAKPIKFDQPQVDGWDGNNTMTIELN